MENFARDFMELLEGTEVPDTFAFWAAIGAISCALGRRCYIDMGHYRIFPNTYIVLTGGSGVKKSTAVNMSERFVKKIEPQPNLIAQKITPEALIKAIRGSETEVTHDGKISMGPSSEQCVGFTFVDELATFLNKNVYDAGLGSLLTPLYDCKDEFEYQTLSRGKEKIKNLCFGILGGATVDWLQQAVPESAVGGGVTSRFIFVYVEDRPKPVAITKLTPEKREITVRLERHICRIATYKGEVKLTEDGWKEYSTEYNRFYNESPFYQDKTLSGYANRRAQHHLKLAMLLAVSESPDLVIQKKHLVAAKMFLEAAEVNMPIILSLITASSAGASVAKVYSTIKKYGSRGISRPELLRLFSHQLTSRELSEVTETLQQSNRVYATSNGQEIKYYVKP